MKAGGSARGRWQRRRGNALVEFALVLPILALVLFGIIQYGFIFAAYITLRNASAVGARYYAINPTDAANARELARQATGPMLDPARVTVTSATTNLAGVIAYSITVSYDLPLIIPFVVPGRTPGSSLPMAATSVSR